ncbi:subtilisin family serine protease [Paenibacillus sp. V4I9]|uniref:S8 family serine peptidase n=1 Tax=Paenibacillus sp. V4I9 TaxID=3042308 RepID=UPI002784B7DC|nr:S8 family serine peptidase [Paenibacillus sp. V4I9]MDQ0885468.1 subtilisin family serine protease [Paenibacillus sp. V4I9]
MKRKWTTLVVSSILAVSTVMGGGISAIAASKSSTGGTSVSAKTYVIAFSNQLPTGYAAMIQAAGGQVVRAIPEIGGLEVRSSSTEFMTKLQSFKDIAAANVQMVHKLSDGTVDPSAADGQPVTDIPQPEATSSYWDYQWDIKKVTNDGASFAIETGGTGGTHKAVVGVIDSGIDANHPDLKANFLGGMNFVPAGTDTSETGDPNDLLDREGHGTHVAGSIAGNGKVRGVGPNLGIRSYRVFPGGQGAPTAWIVAAIIQAANDKVDVINMSIGGFDSQKYYVDGTKYSDVADILLWKRAIQYAVNHNVTVVTAAGNEGLNLRDNKAMIDYLNATYGSPGVVFKGKTTETPGQINGVINVSSSNKWSTNSIAFYSNYGLNQIDVAAPGGDNGPVYAATLDLNQRDFHYRALSTWPTYLPSYFTSNLHSYALLHGTSMAAPKVAGIAGVIKAAHPELNPAQVAALIEKTANDYGPTGNDALYGAGEANVYNALVK